MSEVRVFGDPASLTAAAAERVVGSAARAIAARGSFRLALSGGRTPEALYRALAGEEPRGRMDWTRVQVYFADERAVPPDDPASNFRMARECLIDPARLPSPNIHRMKGESADLEAAAIEYEALLDRPLDLVILGVGEDGHTASIFPGSPLARERRRRVAAVTGAPKPPSRRLTLTARALLEAEEVLVLATGTGKARAVAAALEGDGSATEVPARLARSGAWYLDRAAAALLEAPRRPEV